MLIAVGVLAVSRRRHPDRRQEPVLLVGEHLLPEPEDDAPADDRDENEAAGGYAEDGGRVEAGAALVVVGEGGGREGVRVLSGGDEEPGAERRGALVLPGEVGEIGEMHFGFLFFFSLFFLPFFRGCQVVSLISLSGL